MRRSRRLIRKYERYLRPIVLCSFVWLTQTRAKHLTHRIREKDVWAVTLADSLTAYSVASGENSLRLAAIWWPVGFALAIVYFVFISRRYLGKVSVKRDTQGYY